jgi:XTP/dITP diphosphohydrolase
VDSDDRPSTTDFRLVLATRNPGKVREFRQLLGELPLVLKDLRDFPDAPQVVEDGESYLSNARLKALALARFTGLPCLADDSGIEVDALDGAPGIHSARFAGPGAPDEANRTLILDRLRDIPEERRRARFRCLIVVARPDGQELVAEGTCEGFITREPRGNGGFGYDPVFFYPPTRCTTAELSDEEKNQISHRANACAMLVPRLVEFLTRNQNT